MLEKVGRWYVFRYDNGIYRINEEYVNGTKLHVTKIDSGFFGSYSYIPKIIDIHAITDITRNLGSEYLVTFVGWERKSYKIDGLENISNNDYKDMVEHEQLKKRVATLEEQIQSLISKLAN